MGERIASRPRARTRPGVVRRVCLAGIPLAVASVLSCGSPPADTHQPSARIVSLAPASTELLFALGAGPQVVGRTRWGVDPPEAEAVPSVGDGLEPNVEAVAGRRPDLVVFYQSPANAAAMEQLAQLGIRIVAIRMDRLEDVIDAARELGHATGHAARADSLADGFAAALDSARADSGAGPRRSVLILSWDQPPIIIGGGSFQSQLVDLAGARNVFGELTRPSAQVSIETIAARDPDIVLVIGGGTGTPDWAERPEWKVVRAVRERRFARVEGTAFSHPSFRALDAARLLRRALEAVPQ